jgi:hypothetical protein
MVSAEHVRGDGKPYVWRTVVGIISNVRQYGLDGKIAPTVYLPIAQPEDIKDPLVRRDLVTRSAIDSLSIIEQVRHAIAAADRDQAVSDFETMDQYVSEYIASRRPGKAATAQQWNLHGADETLRHVAEFYSLRRSCSSPQSASTESSLTGR